MTGPHQGAHDRRFSGSAEMLRSAERTALLEVPRILSLSLQEVHAGTLLDVGTGTGLFAEAFLSAGLVVTGMDANTELLEMARARVPGASFVHGIAERLPFGDAAFDLVFLGLVLHETDDPAIALAEALRTAGKRVVVVEWPYREEEHGPPLAHRLTSQRIEELARSSGFRAVERIELAHVDLYRMDL